MSAGNFKIELGAKGRDRITGYTGIVVARTEWLYGCKRYTLQSQEMHDGKVADSHTLDEDGVEVLEASAIPEKANPTGGPRDDRAALRR